jgi:carbamate kinase
LPDGALVPIRFPKPVASSINYDLDKVLPGFLDELEAALAPPDEHTPPQLTMARYQPENYPAGRQAGTLPPGAPRLATAIVTAVEVDPADPEFSHPTKPVGRFYDRGRAEELQARHGWRMVEQGPRGYRRVVPSPRPGAILELELIARLAAEGELLVAAGGGGIPVLRRPDGQYLGVEAVIDKDRTSALLALGVNAEALVLATNVDRVALDYGRPTQRELDRLTVEEARRHLAADQFPPGSMGPKIESAIEFVTRSTRRDAYALICDLQQIRTALAGGSGTRITAD